ncbi:MAG: hypothetical protein V4580_06585 [Bacteroidota bacterium]
MYKAFLLFCMIVLTTVSFSQTAPKNNKPPLPPPPPVSMVGNAHPVFGTYVKLGSYDVAIPFNGPANISPKSVAPDRIYNSYQYAFPKPTDDINLLYGIDICEFKSNTTLKTPAAKLNSFSGIIKDMYAGSVKGKLIKQEITGEGATYTIRQRIKAISPQLGVIYVTSLYIVHKSLAIRLFVFTTRETENKKTDDYFASIRYTQ